MYSLVSSIENKDELQIITIEDPVEHHSPGFLQIEVNEKQALPMHPSFAPSYAMILIF